jgi:hypothetical protein
MVAVGLRSTLRPRRALRETFIATTRIDREAEGRGTTRSGFLQEAARRELGWPDPARIDAALNRGRTALADAGSFEWVELIRTEREARDARDRRR